MRNTRYGIVDGYHSKFIKEIFLEDGILKTKSHCKNIDEIPCYTKKEAITICNTLNKLDFFARQSGTNLYYVYKLNKITR